MSAGQTRGPSMGAVKLHRSLVDYLHPLPDDVDRLALLECLQRWLEHFVGEFGKSIRLDYGLDEYVGLDLHLYPLSRSTLDAPHVLRCLRSHERPTLGGLASSVSSVFWEGITVDTDVDCPRCEYPRGLQILESSVTKELVFSCHLCAWVQTGRGEQWSVPEGARLRAPHEARLEQDAREFAETRHATQRYGDRPYVVHLTAVREVLRSFDLGGDLAIAAWLHDVLEDTATSREELRARFGADVDELVWAVTGVGANRKERNASAYTKIRATPRAGYLKLADRIANVEASRDRPDKLAMYRSEQQRFEQALEGLGSEEMWNRLRRALGESPA